MRDITKIVVAATITVTTTPSLHYMFYSSGLFYSPQKYYFVRNVFGFEQTYTNIQRMIIF